MTEAVRLSVFVLGGLVLALQAFIVIERVVSDRRRRKAAALRPALEIELANYLVDLSAAPPARPRSKLGRRVLREVALEAIVELRGRERERLVGLLEQLGAIDDLCMDLLSRNPLHRRHAAEALGEINSGDAADSLLFGAADPDIASRLASARALAQLGKDDYSKTVVDAADAAAELHPGATAAVLLALGANNPSGLADALRKGRSLAGRLIAAAVIAELRLSEHAPLLVGVLRDEDDDLVCKAARGLGDMCDPDAIDPLLRIVEAPASAWSCRAVAGHALGSIGDPRAAPALETMLENDEHWVVRDRAARALAKLGQEGEEALVRANRSPVEEVRELAGLALST